MKHKLTPVPGVGLCVRPRAASWRDNCVFAAMRHGIHILAASPRYLFAAVMRRGVLPGVLALAAAGAAAPASGQIIVSIEVDDASAAETPADRGRFIVQRVGGSIFQSVQVTLSTSGTATEGADYSTLPDHITLSFGQPAETIDIVPGDDGVFEGEETVTVTLMEDDDDDDEGDGVIVSNGSASLTISDSPHSVSVSAGPNATEGASTGEFVIDLGARNESGADLAIEYAVAGSAEPGVDYEALGGTAVIPVGASTAAVTVSPLDDEALENDETVEITLEGTSDSRVSVGSTASASIAFTDDDAAGDDDADGLSNGAECPDFDACLDTDEDAVPDYQDPDDDNDGIPTASENPPDQDTDNDGVPDYHDPDDDNDGRPTPDEDANTDGDGNPATDPTDVDGDRVPDYLDADDGGGPAGDADGDGLSNEREGELGTDPRDPDSDDDGVNDGDEDAAGTDPLDNRSFQDSDGDLVPDAVEVAAGSNPEDPRDFVDGDGGGTADHVETVTYPAFGVPPTNPADAADDRRDHDGDGLPDRFELALASSPDSTESPTANGAGDDDGNGITNAVEAWLADLGISAVDAVSDFDRDGYPDAAEVTLGLDPLSSLAPDDDGDGVPNVVEALAGVDANAATDTDGDGVPDAREIALGSNLLDANSPVANGAADDDGDGVTNAIEHTLAALGAADDVTAGSDLDGDGIGDADEIRLGSDPFRDGQPVPWIELVQAELGPVRGLSTGGGQATARTMVGGHQSGLTFDWSATSDAVLAVSSGPQNARTLVFAPETLPPGAYDLVVQVGRTIGGVTTPLSAVRFTLEVLADASAAILADSDSDGVPDASDAGDGREGFANQLASESIAPILAEAGVRLQLGAVARGVRANSALVTARDIAAAGEANGGTGSEADEFEYLGGIYDFEVTNLPEAGAVVHVVIPQASPIGEAPQYRKFVPGTGWTDFVEDDNDAIASAPDSDNECPPPGDEAYQPGLTPGDLCIQLSIEDGGPNDGDTADGPNGVIKDPGGVATPEGSVVVGQGSGAAGPFALVVLTILAACAGGRRIARHAAGSPCCRLAPHAARSPWRRLARHAAARARSADEATVSKISCQRWRCHRGWQRALLQGWCMLAAACCLLAGLPAARADMFIGGGAGMSRLTPDTSNTPFTISDNGDYGVKVFAGFDLTPLSPNLSVEAFWADLGQTTLGDNGSLDYTVYGAGLLYGIGSVRAPRVSGYVELGVTELDIEGDILFQQEDSTSMFLGLAGSFAIKRHLFLQLEYEYFAEDAQFISLSLVRRFRTSGGDDDEDVRTIPLPERPTPPSGDR